MTTASPQNPYHSYIVNAAAGAGKTWQLSRRFLFLVGAHAAPHEILTITFTRKAAAEMRARVIALAAELAVDTKAQQEFDQALSTYHKDCNDKAQQPVRPPRRAQQVGNTILNQSQKLKIATIDSVCSEWLSSLAAQGFAHIPSPFRIITDAEVTEMRERSWQRLWSALPDTAQQLVRREGLLRVQRIIATLQQLGLPPATRLQRLPVPTTTPLHTLTQKLTALSPAFAACNNASTYAELQALGVWRRKKINRQLLTVQQQKQLRPQLQELDAALQAHQQAEQLAQLNNRGTIYFTLWQNWLAIYQQLKQAHRALDFQDLTTLVQQALDRDAGLLFYLQQRIAHLMLDEFQDTSTAQWEIFHHLSCELLAGDNCVAARQGLQATVFIVGDTKQSIYAFRGANAQIMHTAATDLAKFTPHHYPLTTNYRSAAHLLAFFNVVFPALQLPDFKQHQAAPGEQQIPDYGTITLAALPTTEVEKEAEYVAQHIAQTLRTKPHLSASDICILYRNSTHADHFRAALLKEGISSVRHEERGFFAAQTSRDLLALCKWLALPQDQQALLTVLHSPLVAIPITELLPVYAEQQKAGQTYHSSQILQALASRYPQQVENLQKLQALRHKSTPCQLLLYALQQLNALHTYRQHGGKFVGRQAQQNIIRFIDIVATAERDGYNTCAALYQHLQKQAQHDSTGNAAARADAVTMMTIHKAKGLQFPYVILVQAQENWTQPDNYWLKTTAGITYTGVAQERPKDSPLDSLYTAHYQATAAESLRLLYVALTRAEHYLLVCGRTPKRNKARGFLPDIIAAVQASQLPWRNSHADGTAVITLSGTAPTPSATPTISEAALPSLPTTTAPTQHCALAREVRILLPHQHQTTTPTLGEEQSPAARIYGIYLHKALEQQVKQAPPPDYDYWRKLCRAAGLDAEDKARWQQAERTYQRLLAAPVWQNLWHNVLWSKAEMPIVCLDDDDTMINGVIDLLIAYPQQRLLLIDYKTGKQGANISHYQQQLAVYCRAIGKLYPHSKITSALLFTTDCQLVITASPNSA